MSNLKVKEVVTYNGHSIRANGSVTLTLKASYSELVNTISVMQMLNNDVTMKAKIPGHSPFKVGSFRVQQITVDDDGESTLKFNGVSDYIEMDNLNMMPLKNDDNAEFVVLMEAEAEDEDGGDDDAE